MGLWRCFPQQAVEESWSVYFTPLFYYNLLLQLPPFHFPSYQPLHPRRLISLLNFIRLLVYSVLEQQGLLEVMSYAFYYTFNLSREGVLLLQWRRYQDFLEEAKEFLEDVEKKEAGFGRVNRFQELWRRNKPQYLPQALYLYIMAVSVLYLGEAFYHLITDPNKTHPIPLWCPFYHDHVLFKWMWAFLDIYLEFYGIFLLLYFDCVFIYFYKFQICQLRYLEMLLLDVEVLDRGKLTEWTVTHAKLMSSTERLMTTLAPNILVSYSANLSVVVISVLLVLSGKESAQSTAQLVLSSTVMILLLVTFGWECKLADDLQQAHEDMVVSIEYRSDAFFTSKWYIIWLRIITARTKKPLRIEGFGLFKMSLRSFTQMLYNVYSFYSGLSRMV